MQGSPVRVRRGPATVNGESPTDMPLALEAGKAAGGVGAQGSRIREPGDLAVIQKGPRGPRPAPLFADKGAPDMARRAVLLFFAILFPRPGASAEPEADQETVLVQAARLRAAEGAAFAEAIEVLDESERFTSVAEVLASSVGVQVRTLGGLGAFGVASIRGSTPGQVAVTLDGIELNAGGFSSVNLSDLSLDALAGIEIFRGGAPVRLGTAGIGGAIALTTRPFEDSATEAAVSYGSFETTRWFFLRGQRLSEATRLLALASLTTSEGDFRYWNDNGTYLNTADDWIERRRNNGHLAGAALLKLDLSLGDLRLTLADDLFLKDQGMAGMGNLPTERARLKTRRNAAKLRLAWPHAWWTLTADLSHLVLDEDFFDGGTAHGEIPGVSSSTAQSHAVTASGLLEANPAEGHVSSGRVELRYERWLGQDLRRDLGFGPAEQLRTLLLLEHDWRPLAWLAVVPAARLELHRSAAPGGPAPDGLGEIPPSSAEDLLLQGSLGARFELARDLWLRLNASRAHRAPDLSELYGNRGALVGNPKLKPERGWNTDLGLTWAALFRGPCRLRLEAVGFGSWTDDLIAFVQNSQHTIRPENLDRAAILGLELSGRLELFDLLGLSMNYTFLHGRNESDVPAYRGKELPGRTPHEAWGRIELGHAWPDFAGRAWAEASYASRSYTSIYNSEAARAEERLLFTLGLRLEFPAKGLSLTVEAKNLLDTIAAPDEQGAPRPLYDFYRFPLPGRTILATLHWRV